MILDNDPVIARPRPPIYAPRSPSLSPLEEIGPRCSPPELLPQQKIRKDEPGRFKITFINAELARDHAKKTRKDNSEPLNGILAFNGELVSRNTTVVGHHLRIGVIDRINLGTIGCSSAGSSSHIPVDVI